MQVLGFAANGRRSGRTAGGARRLVVLGLAWLLGGCSHLLASFNEPLPPVAADALSRGAASAGASALTTPAPASPLAVAFAPQSGRALRTTLAVDGSRGQPRALVYLALSGGGSRAAYMSAGAMIRLARLDPDFDFMAEVDVMSAVSGGSLAAGYYAATRDEQLRAPDLVSKLQGQPEAALAPLQVDETGALRCAPVSAQAVAEMATRLLPLLGPIGIDRVQRLCEQAALDHLRVWSDNDARERLSRNFLLRWVGNMLWPANAVGYWATALDRSDIMAQTLADNLFDTPLLGRDLTIAQLNPTRPFLLINATNATGHEPGQAFPFGAAFTFTQEDFADRLGSDIGRYPLARAVMASSTFPGVFANMTLRDWRGVNAADDGPVDDRRFMHVFDGGNSDNLGLRAIKRSLLQLHAADTLRQYDRIVVLLVDAFTVPSGSRRNDPDPRGLISYLVDTNISDAVDSLLQANRARLMSEFDSAELRWNDRDCHAESRNLPETLCADLQHLLPGGALALQDRLVFYHLGFGDLLTLPAANDAEHQAHVALKRRLDSISTSLQIAAEDATAIDQALDLILRPGNQCLVQLKGLLQADSARVDDVMQARCACLDEEGRGMLVTPPVPEPLPSEPLRPLSCAAPPLRR